MRCCKLIIVFFVVQYLLSLPVYGQTLPKAPPLQLSNHYASTSFPLVHKGNAAAIYVDAGSAEVVKIVARAFVDDVALVTGARPGLSEEKSSLGAYPLFIGTLGQSALLDQLTEKDAGKFKAIEGKWEGYHISVVDRPFEGVEKALVVAGSDPRGTAFGVFELSRLMGVSPWSWWADVAPEQQESLYVSSGDALTGAPSVKYRGIFLNDEDWGLQPWAAQSMDTDIKDIGPKTYARIFELLLRLKANLIWPAMHPSTKAFFHYPGNPEVAKDYSIVVGTSHAEPMLRNNVDEWNKESMGPFDYGKNKEGVYHYWDKRAAESKDIEAIYTIGMRGIHDSGMEGVKSAAEAAEILEKIIADQREIISRHIEQDCTAVPQAFAAYKEVLDIYDQGLDLPEDITLVWPDDNYGYIRRLSNQQEQGRAGGAGVYYHASYWGRPHDYLWLSTTHPVLIWEEMWKAYQMNARDIWVLNVGDIKPLEYNIELFMDMAYNMEGFGESKAVKNHLMKWAKGIFGEEQAAEITAVLWEYYNLAFERRPEFMGWSRTEPTTQTSLTAYNHFYYGDEAQQRIEQYNALEKQVKTIRRQLAPRDEDAFYQLVYYPVVASSLINKKFLYRDKAHHYALQGRASAADYSKMAQQAYDSIVQETNYYNNGLAGGKWKGMMSMQPRGLPVYQRPALPELEEKNIPGLGIMPEGFVLKDSSLVGSLYNGFELPVFYPWKEQEYFIDLYLTGEQAVNWKASTSHKWITLSEQKGVLDNSEGRKQKRIWVSVDWAKAPEIKDMEGMVTIKRKGESTKIAVRAAGAAASEVSGYEGYIPQNGFVSIHAENYSRKNEKGTASWSLLEGLGHSGASLIALPLQQVSYESQEGIAKNAPSLDYDFYSFSEGPAAISIHCLPTHPLTDKHGLRLAVSVDNGPVKILDFETHGRSEEWKENVLRNSAVEQVDYRLSKGKHTLKIYMVDPGVILDKILIDLGGLQPAYSTISGDK